METIEVSIEEFIAVSEDILNYQIENKDLIMTLMLEQELKKGRKEMKNSLGNKLKTQFKGTVTNKLKLGSSIGYGIVTSENMTEAVVKSVGMLGNWVVLDQAVVVGKHILKRD